MLSKDYMDKVLYLRNQDYVGIHSRVTTPAQMDLLHSVIGMASEIGELVDAVKRHIFYGENMDVTNILEEFGDLFFYTALGLDVLGFTFEDAMQANINKLAVRYPKGFTKDKAINRNLTAEAVSLEHDTKIHSIEDEPKGYCDECLKKKDCSVFKEIERSPKIPEGLEPCTERYRGRVCQFCHFNGPEFKCQKGVEQEEQPIICQGDCDEWEPR